MALTSHPMSAKTNPKRCTIQDPYNKTWMSSNNSGLLTRTYLHYHEYIKRAPKLTELLVTHDDKRFTFQELKDYQSEIITHSRYDIFFYKEKGLHKIIIPPNRKGTGTKKLISPLGAEFPLFGHFHSSLKVQRIV